MTNFDVVVIGAGPGGYVAAIRAAQLGLKAAVVEREHLGGICLNWGCIPSKSLLRSAEMLRLARAGKDYGLMSAGDHSLDLDQAVARSRQVSKQLNTGVTQLLAKNSVSVIWGEASLAPADGEGFAISVTSYEPFLNLPQHAAPAGRLGPGTYTARNVILATGARPRVLPQLIPDEKLVWTYFRALMPDRRPRSLIVVGSGAIGSEFASFYRDAGSDVLLVEMEDRILPSEDPEISQFVRRQFQKQGMKILTGATVESSTRDGDAMTLVIRTSDGQTATHTAERVISAVGVVANTEGLGLESLGVEMERGWIKTGAAGRTNVAGLYAIGDVAGPPMLAHKAEHQGIACAEAIAAPSARAAETSLIPACTFCHPHVASIGLDEQRARDGGYDVLVGKFPMRGNGKALAYGEPDGLIKTVFDAQTGKLLGAQMAGTEVSELIGIVATAIKAGLTFDEVTHIVFPHPTVSEAVYESILAAKNRAIHA